MELLKLNEGVLTLSKFISLLLRLKVVFLSISALRHSFLVHKLIFVQLVTLISTLVREWNSKLSSLTRNVETSFFLVVQFFKKSEVKMRGEILEQMQEGMIVKGIVKNITDYGAFIDLGGIDGLLHITDMSWGRVKHPSNS